MDRIGVIKGKKFGKGLSTFGWYCLIAVFTFFVVPVFNEAGAALFYAVVMVLSLLVWYEAISYDIRKGIPQGMGTVLWFSIPSLILSAAGNIAGESQIWGLINQVFNGPFIFGLNPVFDTFDLPVVRIIWPSLIILLLFVFQLIRHIIKESNWQKTPYIY